MAIKFDITYTPNAYAVLGELYYRHVLPDGSYSAWALNSFMGTFPINGTSGPWVLNDVLGNTPEFFPATTYQFYIKQICQDETELDSPISGDIWVEECPTYTVNVIWNPDTSSYDFMMTLYPMPSGQPFSPGSNSIINYSFEVVQLTGGPVYLGTYVLSYTDIDDAVAQNPGLTFYNFPITQADLTDYLNPAPGPILYQITMSITIATSTGTETFTCEPITDITFGECDTYKIHTGKTWSLAWEDCNGIVRKIASNSPQGSFYICAKSLPLGYWCDSLGGGLYQQKPPVYTNGTIVHTLGGYVPSGWTPPPGVSIDNGAVVELPPGPGCDTLSYSYANLNQPTSAGGQGINFTPSNC